MTTVLLTGFEAFGNTPVNPAEAVVKALDGTRDKHVNIIARVVPNVFFECIEVVSCLIEQHQPELVIMMGEYGGRATITVERIAQNLNDSTRYQLVDNCGLSMQGEPTVPGGPVAYYSTLPLRAMVQAIREAGVPADISDVTGTFCCNHLMYGILHYIASNKLKVRAGWIHLPHLPCVAAMPENLGAPSMSVETATVGILAGIHAAISNENDITEASLSRLQI